MSRTRDRAEKGNSSSNMGLQWRLAVYIRLSKEDNVKSDNDSYSVTNQKKILTEHYQKHMDEYASIEYYIDDGFTGTDSNRDDFKRMLRDIQNKKVSCVMVKDLSRLSRNYSEAGNYIDTYFTMWDIRFICLSDPVIDSYKYPDSATNIAVPITNVMNDNFCLQTSKKVRMVFDNKRRRGEFIGAFAPYGYRKHPDNKNLLIVDEGVAPVVQNIFDWFVGGMSKNGIAAKLNDLGIPNPAGYKRESGSNYCHPKDQIASKLWSAATVARILKNQMYIGTMVQGRFRIKSYKVHTQIRTAQKEWFVVEDTHEAIVSRELFEKVQNLQKRDMRTAPARNEVYLFSGFLRCADCRKAMHRTKTGKYIYYVCRTFKTQSRSACTKHSIRHEALEHAVLTALQWQIDLAVNRRDLVNEINAAPVIQTRFIQLDKTIEAKERELAKIGRYQRTLYQSLCDALITRSEYKEMRAEYTAQVEQLQVILDTLRQEHMCASQGTKEDNPALSMFLQKDHFASLTRDLLLALVECIYIKEGGGIAIQFKFGDHFLGLADRISSKG